jgi:hypothetical protein
VVKRKIPNAPSSLSANYPSRHFSKTLGVGDGSYKPDCMKTVVISEELKIATTYVLLPRRLRSNTESRTPLMQPPTSLNHCITSQTSLLCLTQLKATGIAWMAFWRWIGRRHFNATFPQCLYVHSIVMSEAAFNAPTKMVYGNITNRMVFRPACLIFALPSKQTLRYSWRRRWVSVLRVWYSPYRQSRH